jgi:hypothetical protein
MAYKIDGLVSFLSETLNALLLSCLTGHTCFMVTVLSTSIRHLNIYAGVCC